MVTLRYESTRPRGVATREQAAMRFIGLGVLVLAVLAGGCGAPLQSCKSLGLLPGSPEYQRCAAAQAERRDAATRGAVDTMRSLDVRGLGHP